MNRQIQILRQKIADEVVAKTQRNDEGYLNLSIAVFKSSLDIIENSYSILQKEEEKAWIRGYSPFHQFLELQGLNLVAVNQMISKEK